MSVTIEAVFDGKVFLPTQPITLKANTRVQISVITNEQPVSFLDVAESLALDGPPDWSLQLDECLYNRIKASELHICGINVTTSMLEKEEQQWA